MITITPTNYPRFDSSLSIDDETFTFSLDYSEVLETFLFSMQKGDLVLISGKVVSMGEDLLAGCNADEAPKGRLIVSPLASTVIRNPTMGDWGSTHVLIYLGADEVL